MIPWAINHRIVVQPNSLRLAALLFAIASIANSGLAADTLPGTQALTWNDDLSARMVAGIDTFLMREIEQSIERRPRFWRRDFSSAAAYEKSIQPNRDRLSKRIGMLDRRVANPRMEFSGAIGSAAPIAGTDTFVVYAVRWPVLEDVEGEGLLLQPKSKPVAQIIALPDADQTPEMLTGISPDLPPQLQFARRLAENGCLVIVPMLIDRRDTWSGNSRLNRFTNQPHREWIYRQSFEMGRHIIGYEVQKVLAVVDWLADRDGADSQSSTNTSRIGVVGYGEGGLIALYSAALDPRINSTLVSGYFSSRQQVWAEPIYRNVFGLLSEFGDAEIATLIAPRSLMVEHSRAPEASGPPTPRAGRRGAAPGSLTVPDVVLAENEVKRTRGLISSSFPFPLEFVSGNGGAMIGPGSDKALTSFLKSLGVPREFRSDSPTLWKAKENITAVDQRQERQVQQLVNHTQHLLYISDATRSEFLWNKLKPAPTNEWVAACSPFKETLWNDVIGRLPAANLPANPRSRKILESTNWTAYEVVLDVWPDVFAWGILLLPRDLQPGEHRPTIVCQHGLEGVPIDTINGPNASGYGAYKSFAARLADQGFVVFAPHNPYRGEDRFRVLQRKANPLGLSLFSIILGQHDRILDWLSTQPFVDPQRIAFYGLSYGGKTAMRVPALLDRYCLSICSADFNDWVRKNVTTESNYSYMFMGEYELPEFNLGGTFNYAEMAALIAPRPFMVERGHDDGVAPDEWVAYEYAKVRRLYAKLGIPDRTEIEFFNGPHTINGIGTFEFLHRHLNWPKR